MLWIDVDRALSIPLTRQICDQLRKKILTRELQTGERLPASRKLAQELNVSRNVIINVYEQLLAEGYLESREGSGTYIAEGSYLGQYKEHYQQIETQPRRIHKNPDLIDFQIGVPDLEHFPRKIWAKLLRDNCLDVPESLFDYGPPEGLFELRQTLARFLLRSKGIRCQPEQLIILSGSAQGFSIIAQLLATSGQPVIIEDPAYLGIRRIFQHAGLQLVPVAVDEHGIQIDLLPKAREAAFVIVTPSHQFPLGSVLPIQRRVKLIEYARQHSIYIVENDYDSDFRFVGAPISSLQGLDPDAVIHVGTFSESLYPALRLGYMVLPLSLLEPCLTILSTNGLCPSVMKQLALTGFIEEGHLGKHISKMKKRYREKRELLIAELHAAFGRHITIRGDSTGLYVVAEFDRLEFSDDLLEEILYHGVRVYRVEYHAMIKGRHRNKILFGYGNVSVDRIRTGIERLQFLS